jgi:hypothetical protein
MDNILQTILKKLEGIDERMRTLEGGKLKVEVGIKPKVMIPEKKDELLEKAWSIISKTEGEEISTDYLMKALGVDEKRVEKIFDQLEAEGYGTCEWKEVN